MMPRGSASERGYGSLHRNPGLDMDAKAYVRRAWGLCIDVRCTRPASDKYRRGTEVVAQSKPRLYCPKHRNGLRRMATSCDSDNRCIGWVAIWV
jgi:hypothetical protein